MRPSPHLFQTDAPDAPSPDGAPTRFVRVAVERALDLSGGLTYAGDGLDIGQRVEVPLGRGDTPAAGYVVAVGGPELLDGFDPARVKSVLRAAGPRLTPELVELAAWISEYYVSPLGMVLATMMPAAVKSRIGERTRTVLERVPQTESSPETDAETSIDPATLTPSARTALERLRALPDEHFPADARTLAALVGASNAAPINKLLRAGALREVQTTTVRAPDAFWDDRRVEPAKAPPELTPAQHDIVEGIGATLGAFAPHLLRGVTGSGKTEVYLRIIERTLERDQTAIVLVPEIALTPQTAGRFIDRFQHAGVAVLHSGLSGSQRNRQWAAAARGDARVVIGARSAVFAPIPSLGVIVVDEAHDQGYKQDQAPRYHARDVAVMRAHQQGCPVILGSATPSMESWHNARAGRYRLWELTERVAGARMPTVRIVDMTDEHRARRSDANADARTLETVGPTLASALERTLTAGGQAVLLLNRRGFASYIACPDTRCGWSLGCESCDTTMVVHRAGGRPKPTVRCHHCLAEQLVPRTCPVCQKRVIELGAGTQRVERELERRFGTTLGLVEGETFARVDADTMRNARDYFDVLERFGSGELRVLLGTQMIAKGLDVPGVRLVGVINADTSISLPDFRACERTFQLVSQVAGRAGRGEHPGEVIVQTINPREPALVLAAQHDYPGFAQRELEIRRLSRLPPVFRLARVIVRDPSEPAARDQARAIERALRDAADQSVTVHPAAPCPIARIAERYRYAVEISGPRPAAIQRALRAARESGVVRSDAHTAVDVDPVALL